AHLVQQRLVVGEAVEAAAVGLVGDAHLDGGEGVEDVELGDGQLGQRVEPDRVAQHHGVEPTGPAAAPGVGAVLVAPVDQGVADVVEQLGGERPRANPGDVGLGDAHHPVDAARAAPGAGAGAARPRV